MVSQDCAKCETISYVIGMTHLWGVSTELGEHKGVGTVRHFSLQEGCSLLILPNTQYRAQRTVGLTPSAGIVTGNGSNLPGTNDENTWQLAPARFRAPLQLLLQICHLAHGLKVPSILRGAWQGHGAAGYMASAVRKQR